MSIQDRRTHLIGAMSLILIASLAACSQQKTAEPTATPIVGFHTTDVDGLQIPSGFSISIFAQGLQNPRLITFGPDGVLFVAERSTGRVLAFPDPQHTGHPSAPVVVASGLNDPTSLSFDNHNLYVGEANRVTKLVIGSNDVATSSHVIVPQLPTSGNHTTRTVLVGPDGNLYVAIGSTCNDCIESNAERATVMQFHLDGSDGHIYAHGLRNAVGLAVNPWNQQIWATDNGRDLLGDNIPPETVYALQDGGNYGWPVCHAGNIVDPDLGKPDSCQNVIAPLIDMQAHSAPLGLAFYKSGSFPTQYHGLFVAFHGSWNRTVPTGYKVVFIPLNAQGHVAGQAQDFVAGWLTPNGTVTKRPVGLAVGPDGALYISTDQGGTIYRVTYNK
ncbi:MAG TPA: PQQ-dependent sugar dehydrogenase [Ktedonobacterales bacterium]|nr:PQQ-dependent sugar dehydrogenase [Ktedonobacterales bacterium]